MDIIDHYNTLEFIHPKKSAWQAIYIHRNNAKIAYLGIDPKGDYGMICPQIFGGFRDKNFRFTIPYLKWRNNASPLYYKMYQAQNNLLHKLDTRYT